MIDTGGPGGAETVCLDIVSGLDSRRWRPVLVVPKRGWLWEEATRRGVQPVLLSAERSFDVGYVVRLASLAARQGARIIQTHLFGSAVYGGLVARVLRLPMVSTFHGAVDVAADERFLGMKFRAIDRRRNQVVFVSEALRTRFRPDRAFPRAESHVVHNGIDFERFHPGAELDLRRELGAEAEDFLVVAVGNLRPAKSYDVLLRAAARLVDRTPRARLVVIGEGGGEFRDRLLAQRSELGLQDVVRFEGFRADTERVFRAADAFVISSESEGFSLTTVEAMATGLPVVATRCGGPEEILADGGGLLVPRGRPEELAAALERLANHAPLRAALGDRGARIARERFGRDRMVRDYERLYEAGLSGIPAAPE